MSPINPQTKLSFWQEQLPNSQGMMLNAQAMEILVITKKVS